MTHETPVIRDATEDDVPGLCATLPLAFGIVSPEMGDSEYVRGGIKSCAANLSGRQRLKVAVLRDGTVVGSSYSGLATPDGHTTYSEIGVIHAVAVDPAHRRRGIASALLSACEKDLIKNGARVLTAEARPQALDFFTAWGYKPADRLTFRTARGLYEMQRTVWTTALMWMPCGIMAPLYPEP